MLALSRRVGESIQIGDNITVTITGIHGGIVRLSLDAPRSVPIWRTEVAERMKREALDAPESP